MKMSNPFVVDRAWINTPFGPKTTDILSVGDLVSTMLHGAQQIRRIERDTFTEYQTATNPDLLPLVYTDGLLPNFEDEDDLLLSPAVMVLRRDDERGAHMVRADSLLTTEPDLCRRAKGWVGELTYIGLFFDRPEIITVDGMCIASANDGLPETTAIYPARVA